MDEKPKRDWIEFRRDEEPKRHWLQFSLRVLFFVTAFVALACATYSPERGSWQQVIAASTLFLVVFGGMAWAVFLNIREAQARNGIYTNAGDPETPVDVPHGDCPAR
jgi:hypothetical protein